MVEGWEYPDTTCIDGGDIYTGSITANKIAAHTITADKITTDWLTALHIRTASSGSRCEMDSNGFRIYGSSETFYDSGGTYRGVIWGYGSIPALMIDGSQGLQLDAQYGWLKGHGYSGIELNSDGVLKLNSSGIWCNNFIKPTIDAVYNLGDSAYRWSTLYLKTLNMETSGATARIYGLAYHHLNSWEEEDDLQIVKNMKPDKDKQHIDINSVHKGLLDKEGWYDLGSTIGLLFGAVKKLSERLDIIEDNIKVDKIE